MNLGQNDVVSGLIGGSVQIEHFVYGSARRCTAFGSALPDGIAVETINGGLILRKSVASVADHLDGDVAFLKALAKTHRIEYDGWGVAVEETLSAPAERILLRESFRARTGIALHQWFAFRLGTGRFGHARLLGEEIDGRLLVDVTTLIPDEPATANEAAKASRLYRQPIFVWHTAFEAVPLPGRPDDSAAPLVEVSFRMGNGWPDPETIDDLAQGLGLGPVQDDADWHSFLGCMDRQGMRLPDPDTFSLLTAKVSRTGKLKLVQDDALHAWADMQRPPMHWDPGWIDEVAVALSGGIDILALRDRVL